MDWGSEVIWGRYVREAAAVKGEREAAREIYANLCGDGCVESRAGCDQEEFILGYQALRGGSQDTGSFVRRGVCADECA